MGTTWVSPGTGLTALGVTPVSDSPVTWHCSDYLGTVQISQDPWSCLLPYHLQRLLGIEEPTLGVQLTPRTTPSPRRASPPRRSPQPELEAAQLTVATTEEDFPVQRRESVPFLTQRLADPLCGDDDEPFLDKVHQCSLLMLPVGERLIVARTK